MKLLTIDLIKRSPNLYSTEGQRPEQIKIIAKFFDPCSNWTWYVTEYDPKTRLCFGLVKGLEAELGFFSISELESIKGRLGLGIERDVYFGEHTLEEVLQGKV